QDAAVVLARAMTDLPGAGAKFLSFQLIQTLGEGSFGRVFLATQGDLADRPVVLKIAVDLCEEAQTLARLQHTNVVPIYSVHHAGPFRAVCMPYFGPTTLADVLVALAGRTLPTRGTELLAMLEQRREQFLSEARRSLGPARRSLEL